MLLMKSVNPIFQNLAAIHNMTEHCGAGENDYSNKPLQVIWV